MKGFNTFFHNKDFSDIRLRPFVYTKPSLSFSALVTVVLLLPQLIMLAVTKSFSSLLIIAFTTPASLLSEYIYSRIKKQFSFAPLFAAIQGIITGLLLPSAYSPIAAFFITLLTILLCKYAFGGFSHAWANPAVVTVIVAYMINSGAFPGYMLTAADLQSRNTALYLIQSGAIPLLSADSSITAFLNNHIFNLFGVVIPDGYVTLFWDFPSTIPAFRFNFITLISSIIMFSLDMIDFAIPAIFTIVYALLVRLLLPFFTQAPAFQGDVILSLLSSGTLFSTLYVLQWYGTPPVTRFGKVLYGLLAGIIAFLIMGGGTSPVGYMFMVLNMNVLSLLIQVIESHKVRKRIETVIIPKLNDLKEV